MKKLLTIFRGDPKDFVKEGVSELLSLEERMNLDLKGGFHRVKSGVSVLPLDSIWERELKFRADTKDNHLSKLYRLIVQTYSLGNLPDSPVMFCNEDNTDYSNQHQIILTNNAACERIIEQNSTAQIIDISLGINPFDFLKNAVIAPNIGYMDFPNVKRKGIGNVPEKQIRIIGEDKLFENFDFSMKRELEELGYSKIK